MTSPIIGVTTSAERTDKGVDRAFLSSIESGTRNPGVLTVAKLAKVLGVSISALMEGVGA